MIAFSKISYIQVFVEIDVHAPHSRMCLQVVTEMKIVHLKETIEKQRHIPSYLQTLTYRNETLEDSKRLVDYGVEEKSALHLVIEQQSGAKELSVTVMNTNKKTELIDLKMDVCNQSSIIQSLKRNVSFEGRMYHDSVLLEGEAPQKSFITHNSTVYVVPGGEVPLVIRMPGSKQSQVIGVNLMERETVRGVKSKLGGVFDHQLYKGILPLSESRRLAECGLTAGSEVFLVDPGAIPIFVKTRFREMFLCCNPSSRVSDLKTSIFAELGIPERRQKLVFNQRIMSRDTRRIEDYAIFPGAAVYLVVTPNEMDLHVTLPSKKITTLICSGDEKIEDIKLKIEQSEGIPVDYQVLPFRDDNATLRAAKIKPGMLLHLTYGEVQFLSSFRFNT